MKHTYRSTLTGSFLAYRRNLRAATMGAVAVLSISTLRSVQASDDKDTARRVKQLVSERGPAMDDSLDSADQYVIRREPIATHPIARSLTLTPAERAVIQAARPGSRSVVEHKPAKPIEEPLPAGFMTPEVAAFVPAIDPELDKVARAQAAFELDAENHPLLLTA